MPSRYCKPAVFALLGLVLGCSKPDPIVTYTVPKHETIQVPLETPKSDRPMVPPFAQQSQSQDELRMLAALVLTDKSAWSIKAMGPPTTFPEDASEQFDQLVQTLEFDSSEKPTWELTERWKDQGPSGMRAATLFLDGLEFSVIQSTWPSPDKAESILKNVNRWRGQVRLPDVEVSGLNEATRTIATRDKRDAIMLDIRTPQTGAAAKSAERPQAPRSPEITGNPPQDWQPQKPGSMQRVRFAVKGETGTAEVSISRAGGPILLNVNRWRGQVGLPKIPNESELQLEKITVDGQPGLLVECFGDGEKSSVIAMIPESSPQWFFKINGETQVVKQQLAAFRQYLTTVQINQ